MKLTAKVDSHHTNPNYKCLLVNLLPLPEFHWTAKVYVNGKLVEGPHVRVVLTKADLIPRNEWLMQVVQGMSDWKPTEFYPVLRTAVLMGDFERGEWR